MQGFHLSLYVTCKPLPTFPNVFSKLYNLSFGWLARGVLFHWHPNIWDGLSVMLHMVLGARGVLFPFYNDNIFGHD